MAEDVRAAVQGTPLAGAPVIATSVVSGEGLDALRTAITSAASALPARDPADLFRLPVDRAFTVKGTGTVVTGTVWSGAISREDTVRVLPLGRDARVRGIEMHGHAAERALPGSRAAIALSGVEVSDVSRGVTLVAGAGWTAARVLLAEVALLESAPRALGPRTAVRFHLGTQDLGARVVCPGGKLASGASAQARIALDHPVVARAGDRFVLRGGSPLTTIGGGIVNDPAPPGRRARPWPASAVTPAARLERSLENAGARGVPVNELALRTGATPAAAAQLATQLGAAAIEISGTLYPAAVLDDLDRRLLALVDAHQAKFPLDSGAQLQSIRAKLAAPDGLVDHAVNRLTLDGTLELDAALIRRTGYRPKLDDAQSMRRQELLAALQAAGREPPSVAELEAKLGKGVAPLLRMLDREGAVIAVEPDRYYAKEAVEALIGQLRSSLAPSKVYPPSDLRTLLGVSRKYLIPLLEYLDRTGVTRRHPDGRQLV